MAYQRKLKAFRTTLLFTSNDAILNTSFFVCFVLFCFALPFLDTKNTAELPQLVQCGRKNT